MVRRAWDAGRLRAPPSSPTLKASAQVGAQLRGRLQGNSAPLGASRELRQICSSSRAVTAAVSAAAASQAENEYRTVQAYLVEAGCLKMGAPSVATVNVVKSPKDHRLYRRLTLPNGIGVLVISDPHMSGEAHSTEAAAAADEDMEEEEEEEDEDEEGEEEGQDEEDEDEDENSPKPKRAAQLPTKRAAAAMVVNIGSFSDPPEAEGLAHFLEHMLFMGSEKYPDENEYDSYLTAHGGCCNAFTEAEQTCYHFDVQPSSLKGALDRFAQFFVAPLLLEGALEREVNSVDSEFVQVLQDDGCRLMQMQCHTAPAGHPHRIFSWGNRKSLVDVPKERGVETRPLLLDYYKRFYKPSQMSLVVLGSESLDTLQEWIEEIFNVIPPSPGAKRVEFSAAGSPIAGPPTLYTMPSVREQHELHFTFALPSLFDAYMTKPDELLSHLVGHEGSGSLLSALKVKGWATKLSAGVADGGHERSSAAWLFQTTITLTEAGLESKMEVASLFFQYLHMLRQQGPQQWVFNEVAAVKDIEFRFQEEEEADEYTVRLARSMHHFRPEHILAGEYMLTDWNETVMSATLERLSPDNMRMDLLTSTFDAEEEAAAAAARGEALETEPWFQVPFSRRVLPASLVAQWRSPPTVDPLLSLPVRNEYIPEDLSLRAALPPAAATQPPPDGEESLTASAAAAPEILIDQQGLRLWHKLDSKFLTPRANVFCAITTTSAYDSPRSAVLSSLGMKLIEDALNETSYLADVAGLHAYVYPVMYRLSIKVDGFNDKLPKLLERICQEVVGHQVREDRFQPVREEMVRSFKNRHMKPTRHANYLRQRALRPMLWPLHDQLAVLETCTMHDVQAFLPKLLSAVHVEMLAHGNLTAAEAMEAAAIARRTLLAGATPLPAASRPQERVVRVGGETATTACVRVVERVKNSNEENSAVESYFQLGVETIHELAMVDLLEQMAYEPCYDVLRTKEQLGYTVSSGMRNTLGVLGYCVVVQSAAYSVEHIAARIDAFLAGFQKTMEQMTDEAFEKHKTALVAIKLQKDKTLYDESDRHWETIQSERYEFAHRETVAQEVRTVQLAELRQWYAEHLAPGGEKRRQLLVAVYGKQHKLPEASTELVDSDSQLDIWKRAQYCHPPVVRKAPIKK